MAMFLGGAVFLGLGWVYGFASGLWIQSEAKMRMHADGTYALEQMVSAASQAEFQSLRKGKELHLFLPASPLDNRSRARERIFQLRDQVLWMDGKPIVPAPGDSGIGVSDLKLEETIDAASGVSVLSLGVRLFSRERPNRASDSIWFETSVHLRNRGIGAPLISGNHGGTSF